MIEIGLAFLFFRQEIGLQLHDKEKNVGPWTPAVENHCHKRE